MLHSWRPTKRALDLGQVSSSSYPAGHGRWHRRVYADGRVRIHYDVVDPDRSGLHAVAHLFVDVLPWLLRGMPR